ncbi:MAG TPA: hypothetical protein VFD70_19480 [Anaerolineae bacterium]|nr:hypothetical protein [Anaerolineae bacterium]
MKKMITAASAVGLMMILLASALAFSLSLQNLNINAGSFLLSAATPVNAVPMTSNEEAAISQPSSDTIRLQVDDAPQHVCKRNKTSDTSAGF